MPDDGDIEPDGLTTLLERISSDPLLEEPDHPASGVGLDARLAHYVEEAHTLARQQPPSPDDVLAAIADLSRLSGGEPDRALWLARVLDEIGAAAPRLRPLTLPAFVDVHMQVAGGLRNRSRQSLQRRPLIARARTVLDRALAVIEREDDHGLDPDLLGNLLFLAGIVYIEMGSRTAEEMAREVPASVLGGPLAPGLYPSLGNEFATTGLQYLLRALDVKRRHSIVSDVHQIEHGLQAFASSMIFVRSLGFPPGTAIPILVTARQALDAVGDRRSFALATMELASAYSSISQPAEARRVLDELLAVDGLPADIRNDARTALASALSEQGRFEEAAVIQRALLDEDEP